MVLPRVERSSGSGFRRNPGLLFALWSCSSHPLQDSLCLSQGPPSLSHHLAPIPESSSRVEDAAALQPRSSVAWNLGSPLGNSAAAQTTASSGITPARAFRHNRLSTYTKINVGTHPKICFLWPRTAKQPVLFSLMNSNEAAMKKCLPNSNLPRVIFHDNPRIQRVYEMEMRTADKIQRKMSHFYDHLKKKFMTDQLRKLELWRQGSISIQQCLVSIRGHKVQPLPSQEEPATLVKAE
ncbi:LOW QUALITY PROTEIN: uncharacterized protein C5orf52 homolog [Suricata suricatta]|uniref:LOW QUALITY PROTEIN: uncharacterized protein C5orf52 homolog n=1 Tax=Suricata suricatta TaxID=37032 RepID=UPI001155AACA|nr:LOW QUALITY PROTEIN: uncharacterized protein C5orf52 homolog [Suricata suricatta]